jgi:RNA polymerase sigma-70 factor (ECF subfamily)
MMLLYLSLIDGEANQTEFERIYLRYEESVFRKLLHILRKREDTEDVMQETWIKVAKNIEVLRGKDDAVVFSYIMKIATNQAMTFFRKQNTLEVPLTDEELDGAVSDDALFTACDRVGIDEIAACFAELPKIYRDVLSLYFFHEHNTDEIAELLDMNPSTVSSRLVRGRKKLILLLERRGIHD